MHDLPNKIVNHLGFVMNVNLYKKEGKHYIEIVVPLSAVPVSYHGVHHYRNGSTKQELKGAVQSFIQKALRKQRILESAANSDTYIILKNLELVNEQGVLLLAAVLLFGKTHNGTQRRLVIKSGALESPTATLNTKM